jgi:hypothetical protein
MLALIKQGDDLIAPNVNGEPVGLRTHSKNIFPEPELPQRPVSGNKAL